MILLSGDAAERLFDSTIALFALAHVIIRIES
jgi:hypothetical protein